MMDYYSTANIRNMEKFGINKAEVMILLFLAPLSSSVCDHVDQFICPRPISEIPNFYTLSKFWTNVLEAMFCKYTKIFEAPV